MYIMQREIHHYIFRYYKFVTQTNMNTPKL